MTELETKYPELIKKFGLQEALTNPVEAHLLRVRELKNHLVIHQEYEKACAAREFEKMLMEKLKQGPNGFMHKYF